MGYRDTRASVKDHYPVDEAGNEMMCIYHWMKEEDLAKVKWLPMEEFTATLTFKTFWYDRDRMIMVDKEGREYSLFFSQVADMIPHMINGAITARFKMAKKGSMYGLIFIGV